MLRQKEIRPEYNSFLKWYNNKIKTQIFKKGEKSWPDTSKIEDAIHMAKNNVKNSQHHSLSIGIRKMIISNPPELLELQKGW